MAAAAYAALVSLNHIIEHSMVHNARQPVFLDKQQRQMECLQQKVSFLQHFLEVYSNEISNDAEGLESRIADAAYAAEDIIESHVVDNIVSQTQKQQIKRKKNDKVKFTRHGKNSSNQFSQGLQKVIETIDSIRREVMEIKEKSTIEDKPPRELVSFVSSRLIAARKDTVVEYHGDDLEQIMDMLTGQSPNLQIISIVGMGGIGKTTLARNVYEDPLIVECFYIRAWVTISQEYDLRALLLSLLREMGISNNGREEKEQNKGYHQFGEKLYKHLSGRKYLIIMDDIWTIEVLEKLKLFFPDNDNGSRVMVTTRLLNVADSSGSSHLYKMSLLDENKSWSLLRRKVFGHDGDCPPELEEIGKDIARNCKGLPLSIVVIGGLLAKSEMTRTYWEYVAKYINQIVNSEDSGHWLKILSLSYNHLPIHLKPCFLYMGVYREDCEIRISELIKLWVAEGFLKPNKAKSLEEVAEDYLQDLVERNLILVRKWGSIGKMKTCGIHDLLRDLCLKEAKKERFLCIAKFHDHAQSINNERRIVFPEDWCHEINSHQFHHALQSSPFIRSFTRDFFMWDLSQQYSVTNLKLLRVLTGASGHSLQTFLQLVNLRYLSCHVLSCASVVLSPMSRLWYLQTLILIGFSQEIFALHEIWEMPQLRHVISARGVYLPDPMRGQKDGQDGYVLKNLQTLSPVINFNCTEEVLKRIPNIKKLCIHLISEIESGTSSYHSLHNLSRLHKLQSLTCYDNWTCLFQYVAFPESLNKLTLCMCFIDWDDFTEKVGSLPHLGKLELLHCRSGAEWNTVEGKFLRLKFLEICELWDLVCWTTESSHFPLLQHLVLKSTTKLKEIPSGLGDTLQSIKLDYCPSSVIASAKEIVEEQQSLGNEGLRLTLQEDLDPDLE